MPLLLEVIFPGIAVGPGWTRELELSGVACDLPLDPGIQL